MNKKFRDAVCISISIIILVSLSYLIFVNIKIFNEKEGGKYNLVIEIVIPLLITLFGTFSGFLLAAYWQIRVDQKRETKEIKKIKNGIISELNENKNKVIDRKKLYPAFYKLDAFQSICYSGKLFLLFEESWYTDLIDLYRDYQEANYTFKLDIDWVQKGKDDSKIITELHEITKRLKLKAENLLRKI